MDTSIKEIFSFIKENNKVELENKLNILPIENLKKQISFIFFNSSFKLCLKTNNLALIPIIVKRWKKIYVNIIAEVISFVDDIVLLFLIKNENVEYEPSDDSPVLSKIIELNDDFYPLIIKYDVAFNKTYFKELPEKLNYGDFKFELLTTKASNKFFTHMINLYLDDINTIYDAWKETDPDNKTSFFTKLFLYNIDIDIIRKIQIIEEKDYFEIMMETIFLSETEEVLDCVIRINKFFGIQETKLYENIKNEANGINYVIYELMDEYIRDNLSKEEVSENVPKYIKDFGIKSLILNKEFSNEPPVDVIVNEKINIDLKELSKILFEFGNEFFILNKLESTTENSPESIENQLKNMSSEEINSLIANIKNEHTIKLIRIYGPSNSFDDENIPNQDRMFICSYYDHDIENEDEGTVNNPNWFTGYCDQCNKIIDNYRYAVRIPMVKGGWKGNFCSWSCVFKEIKNYGISATKSLSLFYKNLLNEIGIQDISG